MNGEATSAVEAVLKEHLEESIELLPFAKAVVQHLSRAPGAKLSAIQIANRVGSSLHSIATAHGVQTSATLSSWPELVASFFQNADLLEPGRPLTRAIGSAVMAAVEEMHG